MCVISILAPTRGATCSDCIYDEFIPISILAPTRGATLLRPVQNFPDRYFNPRSHEGSDPKGRGTYRRGYISILAPTRGATRFRLSARYFKNYFNPRSHEGSDRCVSDCKVRKSYFNPRSHEGSDTKPCTQRVA